MTAVDPADLLQRGSALLAPILEPHGFKLGEPRIARGSGGLAAVASWVKEQRTIETHVRGALGIVTYTWGADRFDHKEYLQAVDRVGAYPGFSSDPIESFVHLAADLEGVASPLLDLSGEEFHHIAQKVRDRPGPGLP